MIYFFMRYAFMLLGVMTIIVFIGAFVGLRDTEKSTSVSKETQNIYNDSSYMSLTLSSPAFVEGERIPEKYTCDGDGVNPELTISGVPNGTQSLVLVMDDSDIPYSVKQSRGIEKFDHWVLYNVPPDILRIPESYGGEYSGLNSLGKVGYIGPCPPDREHRYVFRVYALPTMLTFGHTPTLDEVETIAQKSALATDVLVGRYERTTIR